MMVVRHHHGLAPFTSIVAAVLVLCIGSIAHGAEIGGVYRDGQLVDTLVAGQTSSTFQSTAPQGPSAAAAGPASQGLSAAPNERGARFNTGKEFARHAAEVETLLEKVANKLERGEAVATEGDTLLQERENLLALDSAIRTRFAEREQELIAAGLPVVVLDRHRATVDNYEKNFQILADNLSQIEGARRGPKTGFLDQVKAAHEHLRQHKSKDPTRFLSGNSLPLESVKTKAPVLDISAATTSPGAQARLAAPLLAGPPGPGDLNPTIDVQITQEISDLATQLGNSPLKIYQHVRDNFRFEAYLGSRKGSRETLLVGSGNDYDLASLLIALLRAANVPSRYVAGTVLLPTEQAMKWLGITDADTAGDLLATARMGAAWCTSNGQVVGLCFKHVWVAAYLPYGNYRGVPNDATGKAWVPLDPSFKISDYSPAVDIPAEMGFNAEAFIDNYISTFHTASPVELYLQQIQAYVAASHPELTYPQDVFRHGTITPDGLGLLPASLPYKVLSKDSEYTEIPADKRHQIRFHIQDDFGSTLLDRTLNLPEIASRRVTISYVAATPADQTTIDFYGDLYSTPPNLISVKPVLKVDGAATALGGSIGAGTLHYSDMHFLPPAGDSNKIPVIYNNITAGTYQGIGIDTFGVAPSVLVPSQNGAVPDTDGLTGEKLYRTAMTYLDRVDRSDVTVAETMQMVFTTAVSEAIVENVLLVWYFFGSPVDWEWRGLIVDADRKIIGPFSVAGDTSKEKPFFVLTGADGSISENRIFEDTYNEEAVSTIKILELASDMGVTICRIVTSIAADCPGLSQPTGVVNNINDALGQGHEVTIPRTGITYHQWSGTGYIDMDPATGAAGYIISGGQSGGATVDFWVGPWGLIFDSLFKDICGISANITYPPPDSYFPYPGFFTGFFTPQPSHFDVDYTVSYCDGGSRPVSDFFRPHYQYPPGAYVFDAGWGTGQTRTFTVFSVEVNLARSQECDGESVGFTLVVTPLSAKNHMSNVQPTAKKPGGQSSFDNPAGQGISLSQTGDLTEWQIDNVRWYSTQTNQCNDLAGYKILATFDASAQQGATPSVIFTSAATVGPGNCLDGSAGPDQYFSGDIQIATRQLTNGTWEATAQQGTFRRDVRATSRWVAPANSQYHDMVRDEEQFHEGQIEGTTSTLLLDLWDDQRVMNDVIAAQPYNAPSQNQAIASARAAFSGATDDEVNRSNAEAFQFTGRRCALEAEAKNAAGSSHRAALKCTYTMCP